MLFVLPRIKEVRKSKNLSQIQVAKKIGMEQTQYSRYERGENEIKVNVLIEICKALNVSADYILELTNNPVSDWTVKNQVNINGGQNYGSIHINQS